MRRTKLHEYQNSYAKTMKSFGLQRGIVGSTGKAPSQLGLLQATGNPVRGRHCQIAGRCGEGTRGQEHHPRVVRQGRPCQGKKELADKDGQIAELNKRIKALLAEKERLQERHKSEIEKLRNGYQKAEIDAAIRRAETAEQQSEEKDAVIDRQRKQINLLDRKGKPSAL